MRNLINKISKTNSEPSGSMRDDYYQAMLETAYRLEKTLDDSIESDMIRAEIDNYVTKDWLNQMMFEIGMNALYSAGAFSVGRTKEDMEAMDYYLEDDERTGGEKNG